jgi:triosephosphate isomerase
MPRIKLFAANWKMHKTPLQARHFVIDFLPLIKGVRNAELVLCPPAISVPATLEAVKGSRIRVGAQNLHWEKAGAYTGEISAAMLVAAGCTHVIIGHSERRQYFGETDVIINKKLRAALAAELTPILCVGELHEEREAGETDDILRRQCTEAFREISTAEAGKLTIAYEPCWAIGTGKTATPQMAAEAHLTIRTEVAEIFGKPFAKKLRILYGGSVKTENAKELMAEPQIDGALVGGASLEPKSFAEIVKS